jgi:trans-2-enoyl-CoA reductase
VYLTNPHECSFPANNNNEKIIKNTLFSCTIIRHFVLLHHYIMMRRGTRALLGGCSLRTYKISGTVKPLLGGVLLRTYATIPTEAKVLRYHSHGRPEKVLKQETEKLPQQLRDNEVLLGMLIAPINPADINIVEGVYPISPKLPAVGGNEGVAEVLAVGSGVKGLSVNDWVIPARPGFGTWRTHVVCGEKDVLKVRKDIKPEYAATIAVNPCTALRLLEDFVSLKPGDVVVQNGANSSVGQALMQLANLRQVKTINIIRNRPDYEETVERMKAYGAYVVVTDDKLGTPEFQRLISDLPKPKLALNCVGGQSATEIARLLQNDGTMVTYGGMSRKPVQVPTSLLIFKNIQLRGFWLSRWVEQHSTEERMQMINTCWDLVKNKQLRMWMERHSFHTDVFSALKRATESQRNRKVLLVMKQNETQ